ncbi:multidrug resistance-associated protein 1 [Butyriboletus roseoflavus]|nr:multidrug resistance-associated protein 1 [Butyriboletus roseoflavus]
MPLVQSCDSDGWRWSSRLRDFDLSLCAEEGLILTSLLAILAIAALVRISLLSYVAGRDISRNSRWRLWAKLTLLGLAFLTSLATLSFILTGQINAVVQLPHAFEPLALLLALCLTRFNHLRTRSSSTTLLLFWPCYTIALFIWTRSYVQTFPVTPLVPLKWTVLFLGLLSFVLECFSPDDTLDSNTEHPTLTANIFSIWSFAWMTPLLRKGARVLITEHDLPLLVPHDESANLGCNLQCAIEKHSALYTALFVAYGGPYLGAGLLKLLQDSLAFAQPILLRILLSHISGYQDNKHAEFMASTTPLLGYTVAILMFAVSVAQTILLHQHFQLCAKTGMRVRAGLVTAIYKKSLVLSSNEHARATGDIVNLMSVDATRIQDFCAIGLMAISGPYQLILAFVSLYSLLGWSAFVGVVIMFFSIPLNTLIARTLKDMHSQQMKHRDKRTRLMSELLANIKSIKLYAWEYAFIRRVLRVRNDLELKMLRKIGIVSAVNTTLWGGIPLIVAFSSFATASVFSDRPLTVDVIFPAISLFMLVSLPLGMFSQVVTGIMEALVSVRRLSDFLCAEELQKDAVTRIEKRPTCIGEEILSIRDGEFQWTKNGIQPTLEGINLTVRKGELVGILGRVGAGKSSLLSAIIGDMRKMEGDLVLSGSVAYAAQNPWILSATVRDNILFSHEYDESFYNLVIEACALKPDMAVLPQGDMTEVGEKGITLSGGQRARVALARAVYARADLVLLDDVLAAIDSHVARHIFENVIGPQGLLATKARILVTNGIAYLRHFDQIAYMRRGIILECGSYRQLVSTPDGAIRNIIQNHATNGSLSGKSSGATTPSQSSGSGSTTPTTLVAELDTVEKPDRRASFSKAVIAPLPPVREPTSSGISKEHSEHGRVKKAVYLLYLQAASKTGFCFFVLVTVLAQVVSVLSTMMLRFWGERNSESGGSAGLMDPYLLGYGFLNLASIVLAGVAGLLIPCIVFFEVLQVFARFAITSRPRANSSASTPSRNHPFLHGSLSPCLASPLSEPTTNKPSSLHKTRAGLIETKCVILPISRPTDGSRFVWNASVRIIILFTATLAVAAVATSDVDIGLVALVLSYALNTTGSLNWLVSLVSEVERDIVSVERIVHYADQLPSEAPRELMDSKPPAGWPGAGEVEFCEYSMKYRPELDPVLKDISLTIKPKEKIGIVGRTGAGKSSLLLALFRILEATSGKILIDGVDISSIGLHDLRSVISIVPQSPDMFEGTLRENIDPVGEHQDADIWAALEHAHLKSYVESLPEGLDAPVREGGSSLSAGQRQLLCFARALLRKSKVLVLDEATSAVDLDTDAAIQEIIRGQLFRDVTILTIAHRLNTIVESDRVLVLEHGRVAEFDAPGVLLGDKTSRFYAMAFEAGLVCDVSEDEAKTEEEVTV